MDQNTLNILLTTPQYFYITVGVVLGLLVLIIALLITVIICLVKVKKLHRTYDKFMRGKDAESLENRILENLEEVRELKMEDRGNKDNLKLINRALNRTYQAMGLSKYDAFKGMGGQTSFALALLDQQKDGFVLNAMHSREGCYLYIKEIKEGESEVVLGEEEKKALDIALGKITR